MSNMFFCTTLLLWAGLILGVSFIATPVKFMAPHLAMPVALEIGKATFHVFNKVEWAMLILAMLSVYFNSTHALRWWLVGGLAGIMFLETFWLLPALDIRADQVIAGGAVSPGKLHWIYILADSLKILIALAGAWWTMLRTKL